MPSSVKEIVTQFETICAHPYATARAAAAQGRRVAGYMCTYTPEELLHAGGYLPVRILAWSDGTQLADSLIQAYACTVARGALELMLSGRLDFMKAMVFSHTCDTMQNLADIWRENAPNMLSLILSTPVRTDGEQPFTYFRSEIQRVRGQLETQAGPISDAALCASIDLYNEHRSLMRWLYAFRRRSPQAFSARDMLATVLASFLTPKEDHLERVRGLIRALESEPAAPASGKPRVIVVGAVCQSTEYMAAVDEAGCDAVDDDLCTGSRAFAVQADSSADPIDALARMYLSRTVCPAKHRPGFDPGQDLLEKVRQAQADGVILLFTKFCDPWAFDYPALHDTLEAAGVPSLLVEIEQHVPPSANFVTRVSAFAEMLAAKSKGHANS